VVNDGSTDGTADVVHKFANNTQGYVDEERLIVDRRFSRADETPPVDSACSRTPATAASYSYAPECYRGDGGEWSSHTTPNLSAPIEEAERSLTPIAQGADSPLGAPWPAAATARPAPAAYRQFFGRCVNADSRRAV